MLDQNVIGDRLVRLRGKRPKGEVASSLNISKTALSMYESGARVPRDEIKIRIAEYYGKTIAAIFFTQ